MTADLDSAPAERPIAPDTAGAVAEPERSRVEPAEGAPAWEPPLTLDEPVDLDLPSPRRSEPRPRRSEAVAAGSTFGAGMLQAHKVRSRGRAPIPVTSGSGDASTAASTFGTGMLKAHKVRAKHAAPSSELGATTAATTFGAGVLQQRKSRAPLVMGLLLAAAALAAVILTYR